jgi:hypothetical protein
MKQRGRQALSGFSLSFILLIALLHGAVPGEAQEPDAAVSAEGEGISSAQAAALTKHLVGEWVGARLLCRKEEDNAVRCGKPVEFTVSFSVDGAGSSTDEHFPNSFTYRWKSKSELIIISVPGGDELTLFQLAIQEGFLNFQTYIYLAARNPSLPREASYIHYIFDVHRLE